jgi:hypothetical protein
MELLLVIISYTTFYSFTFVTYIICLADNNRSMWTTEDMNGGLGYVASCRRIACSCGFDVPWYGYLTVCLFLLF